jgi:hypothetical protein
MLESKGLVGLRNKCDMGTIIQNKAYRLTNVPLDGISRLQYHEVPIALF